MHALVLAGAAGAAIQVCVCTYALICKQMTIISWQPQPAVSRRTG